MSKDDRRTPSNVYDPLHAFHRFTLDVAASADNAKCARFFDEEMDGLSRSWAGETVWCNPPFSDSEVVFTEDRQPDLFNNECEGICGV